jgi:hypothetical protein
MEMVHPEGGVREGCSGRTPILEPGVTVVEVDGTPGLSGLSETETECNILVELTSKALTDVETGTVGEIAEPGFVFAKAFCCSEMLGIEETVPLLDVLDLAAVHIVGFPLDVGGTLLGSLTKGPPLIVPVSKSSGERDREGN